MREVLIREDNRERHSDLPCKPGHQVYQFEGGVLTYQNLDSGWMPPFNVARCEPGGRIEIQAI